MASSHKANLARFLQKEYGIIPHISWGDMGKENLLQMWWSANKGDDLVAGPVTVPSTLVTVPSNPPPTRNGKTLVWSDEFNIDGAPDPKAWMFETFNGAKGPYNNEVQVYTDSNAVVKGGCLVITAKGNAQTGYTSSRVISRGKKQFQYGQYYWRARMTQAKGSWPAIWMLGNGNWPACGEIDIMEHAENTWGLDTVQVSFQTTLNNYGTSGFVSKGKNVNVTEWHEYSMDWTPEYIVVSVDGVPVVKYANGYVGGGQYPFTSPQYFLFNIALGGSCGGAISDLDLPCTMEIDYVRVYQ